MQIEAPRSMTSFGDSTNRVKRETARKLLKTAFDDASLVLSTQVLTEFCHVAMNKLSMPASTVVSRLEVFKEAEICVVSPECLEEALALKYSFNSHFGTALFSPQQKFLIARSCTLKIFRTAEPINVFRS